VVKTPGPVVVSAGDQGGSLTLGVAQAGQIVRGDVDAWQVTIPAGYRVTVNVSETADVDGFTPWIRLWAPNGASLGDTWNAASAQIVNNTAVSGTYLVLVASADSGLDASGSYSLTVSAVPLP
jgi:hypothetical protein